MKTILEINFFHPDTDNYKIMSAKKRITRNHVETDYKINFIGRNATIFLEKNNYIEDTKTLNVTGSLSGSYGRKFIIESKRRPRGIELSPFKLNLEDVEKYLIPKLKKDGYEVFFEKEYVDQILNKNNEKKETKNKILKFFERIF